MPEINVNSAPGYPQSTTGEDQSGFLVNSNSNGFSHFVRQAVLFTVFSLIAAAVNLGTGYVLYNLLDFYQGWRYGLSVAVACLTGMVVSFWFNRRYTFARSGRRLRNEVSTFFLVSVGGLILTVSLSNLFYAWLIAAVSTFFPVLARLDFKLTAHFMAVGLVAVYSFIAHKYLSFGQGIRRAWEITIRQLTENR